MPQVPDFKILICEDEYLLASDLAAELETRGATVLGVFARAGDAIASLDEMRDAGLNAAIIDMQLLDGSSHALIELLREIAVPIVVFSGYSAEHIPAKFAGIPVVTKPGGIEQILSALHAARQALA